MNKKDEIGFSDMPTHLRIMLTLLGFTVVSEYFRIFVLKVIATTGVVIHLLSSALPLIMLLGVVTALGKKENYAPVYAARVLAIGIFFDGYSLFVMREEYSVSPGVTLWWPIAHMILYIIFIAILFTAATVDFYETKS